MIVFLTCLQATIFTGLRFLALVIAIVSDSNTLATASLLLLTPMGLFLLVDPTIFMLGLFSCFKVWYTPELWRQK